MLEVLFRLIQLFEITVSRQIAERKLEFKLHEQRHAKEHMETVRTSAQGQL